MRIKQAMSVCALILGSSAAMAGLVNEFPVTVALNPDGSGTAAGAMPTARFSKDKVMYIGCGVRRTTKMRSLCASLNAFRRSATETP